MIKLEIFEKKIDVLEAINMLIEDSNLPFDFNNPNHNGAHFLGIIIKESIYILHPDKTHSIGDYEIVYINKSQINRDVESIYDIKLNKAPNQYILRGIGDVQMCIIKEEKFVTKPTVKLMAHTPNPELIITSAAKLCYSSKKPTEIMNEQSDEDVEKFINNIMKLGHHSILEHVSFTFAIENVSRVTETQLVRHRTGSFSVQSGRYVRRNASFHMPKEIQDIDLAASMYYDVCEKSRIEYENIIHRIQMDLLSKELGITLDELSRKRLFDDNYTEDDYQKDIKKYEKMAIEMARYALPQSLCTHMVFTIDLRNFMNFIAKRRCKRAQSEIQEVANQMLELVKDIIPNIYKYIGADCETSHCKEGNNAA